MATYTLNINERSSKAKTFIKFLQDYAKDNVFIDFEKVPNNVTKKAIDDARKGKLYKSKDVKELFDNIK